MADSNTAQKAVKIHDATVVDIANNGRKRLVRRDRKKKKKNKDKKERRGGTWILVLLVLILLIAAAVFAIFFFNLFKIPRMFYDFAHNLDPVYSGISDKEIALAAKESELKQLEEALDAFKLQLETTERTLKERENDIGSAEVQTNPIYWPPVNEDDVAFMKNIGKIYAAMEPEIAADIMTRLYEVEDMAAIIYYMKQDSAASILENMNAVTAAQITNVLLRG